MTTRSVHFIVDKIKSSILRASQNLKPATLKAGTIPLDEIVYNRLIDNGPVDSLLRVIEVHHSDSSKLLLMSFTAHATCPFAVILYYRAIIRANESMPLKSRDMIL